MLEVAYGAHVPSLAQRELIAMIEAEGVDGTLYLAPHALRDPDAGGESGDPKDRNDRDPDEEEDGPSASVDALLVCERHGLVAFDLSAGAKGDRTSAEWLAWLGHRHARMRERIAAMMHPHTRFPRGKQTVVPAVIAIVDSPPSGRSHGDPLVGSLRGARHILGELPSMPGRCERAFNSLIQGILGTRTEIRGSDGPFGRHCGAIFGVASDRPGALDRDQLQAALSCPQGPQRILGPAGSGKTIALAIKAAHLHATRPDWRIAVTFRSKALRAQFRLLIRRITAGFGGAQPNWAKLHVMRAWGGRSGNFHDHLLEQRGRMWTPPPAAASRDADDPLEDIFAHGAPLLESDPPSAPYDVILIDDAQDLPSAFFRFAYAAATPPKRIAWAEDTFQGLFGYRPRSPERMFGADKNGQPRVTLANESGAPPQDVVLGVCYRSPPRALAIAHALACGAHRQCDCDDEDDGPAVQIYDDPQMWTRIGYAPVTGRLAHGAAVSLQRDPERIRIGAAGPVGRKDRDLRGVIVKVACAGTIKRQWELIAQSIDEGMEREELRPEEVLVLLPDLRAGMHRRLELAAALQKLGIPSHVVIEPANHDRIATRDGVAIADVFSAKETEYAMVYLASADQCLEGMDPLNGRNALYTAITRSSAWVRIYGVGEAAERLAEEYRKIKRDHYRLSFNYPTVAQLQRMMLLWHNDDWCARAEVAGKISAFSEVVDMIRGGQVPADALPPKLVDDLREVLPAVG